MNLVPFTGSITNTLVERASASMVVGAIRETLELSAGDRPVLGSIMW